MLTLPARRGAHRRERTRASRLLRLLGALCLLSAASATSRARDPLPAPVPPPQDPNDAPFMAPPNNQPRGTPSLHTPALAPPYLPGRRLALTLAPTYASFRMPLLGRPLERRPGFGAGLEGDLQLARWIWLRGLASYTTHPLEETRVQDPETLAVTPVANPGALHVLNGGVSGVVGVDLGRFSPLLDVGVGALRIGTPPGLQAGQRDQPCLDGGGCDTGMVCGADNLCRPGLLPELHAGLSLEMQLRRRLAVGFLLRYFALLTAPRSYPIYLTAALRLTARF